MANHESNFESLTPQQGSDASSNLVKELPSLYNNFSTIQQQNFRPDNSGLLTDGSIDFNQTTSPYSHELPPIMTNPIAGNPIEGPGGVATPPIIGRPMQGSPEVGPDKPAPGHQSQFDKTMEKELRTLTKEVGTLTKEIGELLNGQLGGTTGGGDGGGGTIATGLGDGSSISAGTNTGFGPLTYGLEVPTGAAFAPIATVSDNGNSGSGLIPESDFSGPPANTDLATTGNTNVDALIALQQISTDSQWGNGATSISISNETQPSAPGNAAIQQLEAASGDKNFVNDFVNDFYQSVTTVGNSASEGASSRWNTDQMLGYAWNQGEDPFVYMPGAIEAVQQQNPGLTGSALVEAVTQNMGSQFAASVESEAQQADAGTTPGTIYH
jgi:hypothetical protein